MNKLLMFALAGAGLGLVLVIFKLLKKGGKLAAKLPTDYLLFFLVYAVLGLTGFMLKNLITSNPVWIGVLLMIVSLTGGIILTNYLYEKWEWSISAGLGKKVLYLFSIAVVSILAFLTVFLLCEHRGLPKEGLNNDLAWWLSGGIFTLFLPILVKYQHELWNEIPKLTQVKHIFQVPLGSKPPFIESGGVTMDFTFVIPFNYRSEEFVKSDIALPLDKNLGDAFHYKLYQHNIMGSGRPMKKIVYAEGGRKDRVYGWSFYKKELKWWGWCTEKIYLNPKINVGMTISRGDLIFVERVKIWENNK